MADEFCRKVTDAEHRITSDRRKRFDYKTVENDLHSRMKQFFSIGILLLLCIALCSGCKDKHRPVVTQEDIRKYEERNIEINREIVKRKQDTIQNYIKEHNLSMQKTGSGLWYSIKPSGDSTSVKTGDMVRIAYTISLLDGTRCYSSDSLGLKDFKVGQGGVESGLEEAILLMHKGDTADILMPPHLAHGLMGDMNKIPYLAILRYQVILVNHSKAPQK